MPGPIPDGLSERLYGVLVLGMVTERTPLGDRPLSGANVNAWIQTGTFGYSYMWAYGPRLTDVEGRYELSNLPEGAELQLQVCKDGYVQQCAAPPLVVGGQRCTWICSWSTAQTYPHPPTPFRRRPRDFV